MIDLIIMMFNQQINKFRIIYKARIPELNILISYLVVLSNFKINNFD